jgi:hypothetical protein
MAKDLDLLYSDQRFSVNRSQLAEGSTVFRDMFAVTEEPALKRGRLEELPIKELDDISAEDFGYFLAMLEGGQRLLPHRSFQIFRLISDDR